MPFAEDLRALGFVLGQQRRGGDSYSRHATDHLTYWVQGLDDGTALFTWEFAIGEFMAAHGLQVGSDERLNTFLYPQEDTRGPQDAAWVSSQIERTEALLGSLSFLGNGP